MKVIPPFAHSLLKTKDNHNRWAYVSDFPPLLVFFTNNARAGQTTPATSGRKSISHVHPSLKNNKKHC